MKGYLLTICLLPAVTLAASCDDDPADFAEVCGSYAQAVCSKFGECYPQLASYLGDPEVCAERYATACEAQMGLDGVAVEPEELAECAEIYVDTACADLSNVLLVQCLPALKGDKADGSPCAAGVQCESGWCDNLGESCGVCTTQPGEGEACGENRACALGLICGSNNTCVPIEFVGAGEACGSPDQGICNISLACIEGTCVPLLGEGESCGNGGIPCGYGLTCDSATSTCTPLPPLAAVGEMCGSNGVLCSAEGYCDEGICQARTADGESCSDSYECMFAARCNDGVCSLEPPVCE